MKSLLDLKNPPPHLTKAGRNDRRPAICRPTEQTDADADLGRVF